MDKEFSEHDYLVLKRPIALRIIKGNFFAKDLRTGEAKVLDTEEFSVLSLCNGTHTPTEISSFYSEGYSTTMQAAKLRVYDILLQHQELLTSISSQLQNPRFKNLSTILKRRAMPWPYYCLREETPYRLELSLTGACNHRCTYCFQSCDVKKASELDVLQWLTVLEQAAAIGVQEVVFSGGEPTLFEGLLTLVKKATDLDIFLIINTNGALLCHELLKDLHQAGAEYIHMSLPAIHNPLFEKITGFGANLEKVKQALITMKELGFYVRVKMVLIPENLGEAADLVDFCAANKVDCVHLAPFIIATNSRRSFEYLTCAKDLQPVYKMALEKQTLYPQMSIAPPDVHMWNWNKNGPFIKCSGVKDSLTIVPNGDVTFCEALSDDPHFRLGNIQTDTLEDIWNCARPDEILQMNQLKEPCNSCKDLSICNTGCFMLSKMMYKNPFEADPRCMHSERVIGWPTEES